MEELLILFGILLVLLILISTLGGSVTIVGPPLITSAPTTSSLPDADTTSSAMAPVPPTSEPFVSPETKQVRSIQTEPTPHEFKRFRDMAPKERRLRWERYEDEVDNDSLDDPGTMTDEDFEKDDSSTGDEDPERLFKADLSKEELNAVDIENVDGDGFQDEHGVQGQEDVQVEPFDGGAWAPSF